MFNSTGYLPIASDSTLYQSPLLDEDETLKEECNPNPAFTLPSKTANRKEIILPGLPDAP